jgi:predicted DNA binding CopG/RHH family protein
MKFSPGKVEKILITLRIAEDFLEKIDREASRRDLSRNEFICQAIAYAMDNMDSSEEE